MSFFAKEFAARTPIAATTITEKALDHALHTITDQLDRANTEEERLLREAKFCEDLKGIDTFLNKKRQIWALIEKDSENALALLEDARKFRTARSLASHFLADEPPVFSPYAIRLYGYRSEAECSGAYLDLKRNMEHSRRLFLHWTLEKDWRDADALWWEQNTRMELIDRANLLPRLNAKREEIDAVFDEILAELESIPSVEECIPYYVAPTENTPKPAWKDVKYEFDSNSWARRDVKTEFDSIFSAPPRPDVNFPSVTLRIGGQVGNQVASDSDKKGDKDGNSSSDNDIETAATKKDDYGHKLWFPPMRPCSFCLERRAKDLGPLAHSTNALETAAAMDEDDAHWLDDEWVNLNRCMYATKEDWARYVAQKRATAKANLVELKAAERAEGVLHDAITESELKSESLEK